MGTSAGAETDTAPPACRGMAASDPLGDHVFGAPEPTKTQGSIDIEALYFRSGRDASGAYSGTTAYVQVADLTTAVPPGSTAATWYVGWKDAEGATRFVGATAATMTDVTGVAPLRFEYGTVNGNNFTTDGTTTGRLHPGAHGIVEIAIPRELAQEGDTLSAPSAVVYRVIGDTDTEITGATDHAPDSGAGQDWVATPC
jgi:hypothetical protein